MGLVRGAFRTTRRVTRTTYRAGRSVARGRVPSVGVGLRIPGGVGVRVGTRGVSIRTPIARQSIGLSGFRTTLGVPGVAHITVNPTRPSLTAGVGPLRATLARSPGFSVASRFVSVGITTKPLLWARVGPIRVKVPGQVQRSGGRTWHEEVDEQWKAFYQRRPPSVSEQLHYIIQQMEMAPIDAALSVLAVPTPAALQRPLLDPETIAAHRKSLRKNAVKSVGFLARRQRKAATRAALAEHEEWVRDEQAALDGEHARLSALIAEAHALFRRGDPAAVYIVANAMLSAGGANGSLVSLVDGVAKIVVFAPPLEDVHPCKPSYSTGGSPTVSKRTKPERLEAHRALAGASAVSALNAVRDALPGVQRVEVVVVTMSSSTGSLADCPVVASFVANYSSLPRGSGGFARLIEQSAPTRPTTVGSSLPDLFRGEQADPAVASCCESLGVLEQPDFWLEVFAATAALTERPTSAGQVLPPPLPGSSVSDGNHPENPPSVKPPSGRVPPVPPTIRSNLSSLLGHHLEALDVIADPTTALAHWSVVEAALGDISPATLAKAEQDLSADLLLALGRSAFYADRLDILHRLVLLGRESGAPESVIRALSSMVISSRVEEQESLLRELLNRARSAVQEANEADILGCWADLLRRLPSVPEGADDEAEDVFQALQVAIAVLQRKNYILELEELLPRCHTAVQTRFGPLITELKSMVGDVGSILGHVREHPGCLQSTLGQTIAIDQGRVRHLLWYLDHFGRVTRLRRGNSYLLDIECD